MVRKYPPKNTKATGSAKFVSSSDGNSMTYRIRVVNINGVTMAHIHSGSIGKNGPIVVTLFKSATPTGPMNGPLSQGTITSANLEGPLKGKTISDLVKLINDGKAYANVHTQQNPKGEIRGQISTSASASASASTSPGNSAAGFRLHISWIRVIKNQMPDSYMVLEKYTTGITMRS